MRAYDLIVKKRDGGRLSGEEIAWLIAQYTQGGVPDYQMAAMCMAVYFQGLSPEELGALTEAMLRSGEVLDLSDIPGAKVDKHSTGGVGDKISLPLAPLVAACGVRVPMVSGRGLGHTGGTLDKLESIPGFRVDLDAARFRQIVREHGLCLIGQTATIAPADKKLYALRDVTGTVESIPLIASSIMSKKLAEGIDGLVLDVKTGAGAFMRKVDDARALARTMVGIGATVGKKVSALITAMDQPLGHAVGNALEVAESIEVLRGGGPADIVELTVELGAEMLVLGGIAAGQADGRSRLRAAIRSGAGAERFQRLIAAQGGDPRVVEDPGRLPQARRVAALPAPRSGFVTAVDALAVGLFAMKLGAGRARVEDPVDPAVGVVLHRKVGDRVQAGEPLCTLHLGATDGAADQLLAAWRIEDAPPAPRPLVLERVGG